MTGQLSEFQELLKCIDDGLVVFANSLIAKGYGSEKRLRTASRKDLLSVNGVQQGDADLIISHFKKGAQDSGIHMTCAAGSLRSLRLVLGFDRIFCVMLSCAWQLCSVVFISGTTHIMLIAAPKASAALD